MLLLSGQDLPPFVSDVLNGLRFNTRGNQVLVDFEFDTARLIEELRALEEDF